MVIPREYVIQQFYTFGIEPEFNKGRGTYRCSCPICREGKSLGIKKRCFYLPEIENIMCHNCGWSSKPLKWIMKVSGMTFYDVMKSIKDIEYDPTQFKWHEPASNTVKEAVLPSDALNLLDSRDVEYCKKDKLIIAAIEYLKSRRLDTAINRPKGLFLSREFGKTHYNRLIIPFYDADGKLTFFQSRSISNNTKGPKYLSEGSRSIFNFDKISSDTSNIYINEGPINACFIKNGVAVGGIQEKSDEVFTIKQKKQISSLMGMYDEVWVLDSQWIDEPARKKSHILVDQGKKVFIWPETVGKRCKDLNDIALAKRIDAIPLDWIDKHSYRGLSAVIKLADLDRKLGISG